MGSVTAQQDRLARRIAFGIIGWLQNEVDRMELDMAEAARAPGDAGDKAMRVAAIAARIERFNAARDMIGRMPLSVIAAMAALSAAAAAALRGAETRTDAAE